MRVWMSTIGQHRTSEPLLAGSFADFRKQGEAGVLALRPC